MFLFDWKAVSVLKGQHSNCFREIRTLARLCSKDGESALRSWKLSGSNLSHQDITNIQKSDIFRLMNGSFADTCFLFIFLDLAYIELNYEAAI